MAYSASGREATLGSVPKPSYSESAVHFTAARFVEETEEMVTSRRVEFPLRRDSRSSILTVSPSSTTLTSSGIGNDRM